MKRPQIRLSVRSVSNSTALLSAAVALLVSFCGCSTQSVELAAADSRKPAPVWDLNDVEGKSVKSADFKGKVVVLDFWATWCPPCREEIPGFVELQRAYSQAGLMVVGVSLDQEGAAAVKPFAAKLKINYPIVLGTEQVQRDFGGVEAIPTTFLIDRAGRIAAKHVGFMGKASFERAITALLKE